jgi:hypothetical protein
VVSLGGVEMIVLSDCGVTVGFDDITAGWLQVLSGNGGSKALGVPAGLAVDIALPGANATGACSAARVPRLFLDAAQATSGFDAPCEQCRACLRQVLKFLCGLALPLRVRVRAAAPSHAYLPSPWTGDFMVTPQCTPGAAACFTGR